MCDQLAVRSDHLATVLSQVAGVPGQVVTVQGQVAVVPFRLAAVVHTRAGRPVSFDVTLRFGVRWRLGVQPRRHLYFNVLPGL